MLENREAVELFTAAFTALQNPTRKEEILEPFRLKYGNDLKPFMAEANRVAKANATTLRERNTVDVKIAADSLPPNVFPIQHFTRQHEKHGKYYVLQENYDKGYIPKSLSVLVGNSGNPRSLGRAVKILAYYQAVENTLTMREHIDKTALDSGKAFRENYRAALKDYSDIILDKLRRETTGWFNFWSHSNTAGAGGVQIVPPRDIVKSQEQADNWNKGAKFFTDKDELTGLKQIFNTDSSQAIDDPSTKFHLAKNKEGQFNIIAEKSISDTITLPHTMTGLNGLPIVIEPNSLADKGIKALDHLSYANKPKQVIKEVIEEAPEWAKKSLKKLSDTDFPEKLELAIKTSSLKNKPKEAVKLLFLSQAFTESRFNPQAVSKMKAKGISQLMPEMTKKLGLKDASDPNQAAFGQVALMDENIRRIKKLARNLPAEYKRGFTNKVLFNVALRLYNGGESYHSIETLKRAIDGRLSTGSSENNNYVLQIMGSFGTLSTEQKSEMAKLPIKTQNKIRQVWEMTSVMSSAYGLKMNEIRNFMNQKVK